MPEGKKRQFLLNTSYLAAVQQRSVTSRGRTLAKNDCSIRMWHFVNAFIHPTMKEWALTSSISTMLYCLTVFLAFSCLSVVWFTFSRTQFGLPQPEACVLQGAGQRRLRGLAVEKERCEGLLFPEMEEVLVCAEGQLPVLVHQWGGESPFMLDLSSSSLLPECLLTIGAEKVFQMPVSQKFQHISYC